MSKEGGTQAPTRHPLKFRDPDFINPEKIDQEMRRVFDICHGCRRCFNLCDSFPKLFDFIDETEGGEVSDLSSEKFKPVVDACTLCDMCFMTKCPYVPPHEFDLDFPHLMLRYRTAQRKNGDISKTANQLTQIDRNSKIGIFFSFFINWITNVKNKFARKVLEFFTGIDKRVILPRYNKETFSKYFEKFKKNILKKNNIKTFVGGNIGESLCNAFLLKKKYKVHVIELSSFQLETVKSLDSRISVITNLSGDHLDRYKGISDYVSQKKNIIFLVKTVVNIYQNHLTFHC